MDIHANKELRVLGSQRRNSAKFGVCGQAVSTNLELFQMCALHHKEFVISTPGLSFASTSNELASYVLDYKVQGMQRSWPAKSLLTRPGTGLVNRRNVSCLIAEFRRYGRRLSCLCDFRRHGIMQGLLGARRCREGSPQKANSGRRINATRPSQYQNRKLSSFRSCLSCLALHHRHLRSGHLPRALSSFAQPEILVCNPDVLSGRLNTRLCAFWIDHCDIVVQARPRFEWQGSNVMLVIGRQSYGTVYAYTDRPLRQFLGR